MLIGGLDGLLRERVLCVCCMVNAYSGQCFFFYFQRSVCRESSFCLLRLGALVVCYFLGMSLEEVVMVSVRVLRR